MKKILFWAFILRIILAPLAEHGDVINYYYWAEDIFTNGILGFYEREIPNAMPPTYPPVTSYLFWASGALHLLFWKIVWFINASIKAFPSNLIFWLEGPRGWYFVNKLPAIIADLGIIVLLHQFISSWKTKKAGNQAAIFFAFNPVFWYNSALWGQTDSVFALPMLGAFFALHKERKLVSALLFLLAILVKPTAALALPVFAIWWLKKANVEETIKALALSALVTFLIYFPFHRSGTIVWIINFFKGSLGGELNYIVANAFNIWGLIFGFENIPETASLYGLKAHMLGYLVFLALGTLMLVKIGKSKLNLERVLTYSALFAFFAFLVLPRMHERYFYPVLILLTPVAVVNKRFKKLYFLLSGVHLINLYNFWWVPKIKMLVELLSQTIVLDILIIYNLSLFINFSKLTINNHEKS